MGVKEIVINECECEKCGHKWRTRGEKLPKVCPSCKSLKWNEQVEVRSVVRDGRIEIVREVGEGVKSIELPIDERRLPGDDYKASKEEIKKNEIGETIEHLESCGTRYRGCDPYCPKRLSEEGKGYESVEDVYGRDYDYEAVDSEFDWGG